MVTAIASDDRVAEATALDSHSDGPFVERRKTDRRQGDRRQYRTRGTGLPPGVSSQCTGRERQIIALLVQGLTNKEIATGLGIVEDTVKKHLQHVYNKLGVRRRALIILGRGGVSKPKPLPRRTTFVE